LDRVTTIATWSFLTNHARVLVCIAHDPGIRLREIAQTVGITERSAFAIVGDLAEAGYVVKQRDGRRNRYEIQVHLPLPEAVTRESTIGEILDLLVDTDRRELGRRAPVRPAADGAGRPTGTARVRRTSGAATDD
jgi:hypothetical protein